MQQALADLISGKTPPDSDAAYLSRIVRNLALNHLDDTRRRSEVPNVPRRLTTEL